MADFTRRTLITGGASAAALLLLPGAARATSGLPDLERRYAARIGAYALDTGNGRVVRHRSSELFPLLSTFKVIASAAVLDRARHCEPGLMDRVIHYSADDLVSYSPITEQHVEDGMTVAELCRAAITYSDNTAGNLILDRIGGPAGVTRYVRGLGDRVTRLDRYETDLNLWSPTEVRDTTTPEAAGRDLRALTLGSALHPDDRAQLVAWLRANTTGGQRIRAGLPADWTIGDKTGSGDAYGPANDLALVQPPAGAPLIMAVYTNKLAADAAYENALIAETATVLARSLGRL
ncbi:class A beta-lactamase [Nucisporomicrobium flavum]|uniref:class A beta-lactamase n=1 Tax=Nucisporomicrobium flavum TaxID=2785915 RepID=UPI0018F64C16|nr:class A beta-lactamase [Nucisporomicrobium flavum]